MAEAGAKRGEFIRQNAKFKASAPISPSWLERIGLAPLTHLSFFCFQLTRR